MGKPFYESLVGLLQGRYCLVASYSFEVIEKRLQALAFYYILPKILYGDTSPCEARRPTQPFGIDGHNSRS